MTQRQSVAIVTAALALVALLNGACGGPAETDEIDERTAKLAELAKKREGREGELAAMNVARLADELQKESERGVEAFNSMPYRELVSRDSEAASELKSLLSNETRASFLGLLALRQLDSSLYRELASSFRVSVLIDALRNSTYFNAWGLPHQYWEDAAKALIDEDQAAYEPLRALLDDKRPAPMWGSEEVFEYQKYSYRVCDYAWALLKAIQDEQVEIPVDTSLRDELMSSFESPE